ncbi:protein neprosin-like [Nicotiana tabacum]|uniref:protein neprosin-like n=1 Tax=Nicotiana tabacum TaxID=4097 RepID=UPI003F4E884E
MLIRQRIVQVQQTLLVLYFLLSYNGVQGEKKLSKLEDSELEKQLKLLNKPAVKTIKKKYGDTYDCINFYKQPAFDHPLLKNHDIHPKIKLTLASTLQNSDMSAAHEDNESSGIWLKERGYPFETSNNSSEPKRSSISSQGYKLAIVQIPNDPNNKFAGAGMSASLWNPHIESQQHTACRLKIQKGSDSLQAGWRAGNTHRFNTLCPGFVIVSSKYPVDGVFDPVTQRGDKRDPNYKTTVRVDDSDRYGVMDVPHWRGGKYQHMAFYGGPVLANNHKKELSFAEELLF